MAEKPAAEGAEGEAPEEEKKATCGEKYEACIIFVFKVRF
jgi:hypothetical protein